MKKLIILLSSIALARIPAYDVAVVGPLNNNGSFARVSMALLDMWSPTLKTTYIPTENYHSQHQTTNFARKKRKDLGKYPPCHVAVLTDLLSMRTRTNYEKVPQNAQIKIAISVLESTAIPRDWPIILNEHFDAVVVHDDCLVDVYRNSGVKIPIFVLPVPIYLKELFELPRKTAQNKIFTFGSIAENWPRKNLPLLVRAFDQAFHENKNVRLLIHSKKGLERDYLQEIIDATGATNIAFTTDVKDWPSYVHMIGSLDCYVLISKGEGFSITPREALAAGIPVLLSNNSAHKTICKTGYTYALETPIAEPAYYAVFHETCGQWFTCTQDAVAQALTQVYTNYTYYLQRAQQARGWCTQYTLESLHPRYMNLVKPKKVIIGSTNEITNDALITTSPELAQKYLSLKR